MGLQRYSVTCEREFEAPLRAVWAVAADTNRWDRAAGLTAGRYSWRDDEDGLRVRVASATELGFDIEWVEPPYEWIEGRFIHGERRFLRGPVASGGFTARFREVQGRTRVSATPFVAGEGVLASLVARPMKLRFRRAIARYFDSLERALLAGEAGAFAGAEPAMARASGLLRHSTDPVIVGPRSDTDRQELERRASALRASGADPVLVRALLQWLSERPDEDVAQMRPFELARLWGSDRRATLRAFLHATQAGLLDLRWQVNCPVCRVAASVVGSLSAVRPDIHCAACNISYEIDFDRHVEAVFHPSAAIRRVDTRVYCASSPAFLPHVMIQLRLAAGGDRNEACDLGPGRILVRSLNTQKRAELELFDIPERLVVELGEDEIALRPQGSVSDGASQLSLVSRSERDEVLMFERVDWSADAVLGCTIASMPEFRRLFASEAPAQGGELSITHVVLLFSDLTGSTALYERLGDARAFAVVQEHFAIVDEVVARHGGATVKTIGDAVMASFERLHEAVAAAVEMARVTEARHGELGVAVKLGVHAGPCLLIRANDRWDFFGTTVNVAARLQAKARGGELVLLREHARAEDVTAQLAGLPARSFPASLKGIAAEQHLVGCSVLQRPAAR